MARHGERIRKRKDGRWEGRYKVGNDANGKTLYRSIYAKTYAEVKGRLKTIEGITVQNDITQKKKTFSQCIEAWFVSVKLSLKKSTISKYEYLISNHILPELGKIQLSNIDSNTINKFTENKLEKGSLNNSSRLSKSYVRSMVLIISAALNYAAEEGWCKSISAKINKPSPNRRELPILSSTEQRRLEKKLVEDLTFTTVGMLITLKTGLRIGEICALKWDDFDFKNNILYVRSTVSRIKNPLGTGTILVIDTPKTSSSIRAIPFNDEFKKILTKTKNNSNSSYVVSDKDTFLSPRTYEYRYHKFMKRYKFPELITTL